MYSIGDKIMYGGTGVCEITEIKQLCPAGSGKTRPYYVLKPLYQAGTIQTPVDNNKVPIRGVLTKKEAEELVDSIPSLPINICMEKNLSALRNYYRDAMSSFESLDLLRMTKSIYAKKADVESRQKKIGMTDEKFLRRAEDLLYGELAVALGIPMDSVPGYIAHRLANLEVITE